MTEPIPDWIKRQILAFTMMALALVRMGSAISSTNHPTFCSDRDFMISVDNFRMCGLDSLLKINHLHFQQSLNKEMSYIETLIINTLQQLGQLL